MGANGLSKAFRKQPDPDKGAGAQDSGGAVRSDPASRNGTARHWNEDAQDQISALLEQVQDEDQDENLDLSAMREALAGQPVPPPTTTEPVEEPARRLKWLTGLVKPDTPPSEPAPEPSPPPVIDEVLSPQDTPATPAPDALHTPLPRPSQREQSATMRRLFKDEVVMEWLEQDLVTLPQALRALRQKAQHPGQALWRIVIDLSDGDRDVFFKEAARAQGFQPASVGTQASSRELVETVFRLFPERVRESLFTLKLLPLRIDPDDATQQHRLVLATHDPSHPDVQRFVQSLGVPVDLHYADEDVVARHLDNARSLALDDDETPSPSPAETTKGGSEVQEIRDLSEEAVFLETAWTPASDAETGGDGKPADPNEQPAARTASRPADRAAPDWKPLADLEGVAPDEETATLNGAVPRNRPAASSAPANIPLEPRAPGAPRDTPPANDVPRADDLADADLPGRTPAPASPAKTKDDPAAGPPAEAPPVEAPPVEAPPAEEEARVETPSDAELKRITAKDRVVGTLLRKGTISPKQIKRAQAKQDEDDLKEPLWRVLTLINGVDREAVFAEAARVYAFRPAEIADSGPDPEFARSVMNTFDDELRDTLLKLRVVPFVVDLDQQTGAIKVVFITHDPTRPDVHRTMQTLKLERFELRYAPEHVVLGLIHEAFPRKNEFLERLDEDNAFDLGMSYQDSHNELVDEDALEAEINRSKLINLFEATLVEAVRQDASDVHIWPNAKKQVEIHFRLDGRLRRWHLEDKIHPEALIAVIKDNSINVDRFERDSAQDGFIQRWIDEALIRFRVSVLPIANAAQEVRSESIVIRVLDDRKVIKDLRQLGLHELAYERFQKAINQPHGMVILTGPTGSGKTTTLYASLHEVVSPHVNVLTVEDPVEYILPGVRQIKLNNKLGLEGALRSILRHDPDIVMVGEMRDRATAELAIKLANTGHLTFSTLHTNDAASAVTRLYKMGIEPFLIAYAINLVVAQRLIRKLCSQCKRVDRDPDEVLMSKLGFTDEEIAAITLYEQGDSDDCPTCRGVGYKGRRAVSEAMYFSREIRHLIADSEGRLSEQEIKDLALKQGMMTLRDSAREVVKAGDTSLLEMLRVISSED